MLRLSRRAIFISDLNNFECGGLTHRVFSQTLNRLGLWRLFQFLKTGGKIHKTSAGDRLFYSYSLFNDLEFLRACLKTGEWRDAGPRIPGRQEPAALQ